MGTHVRKRAFADFFRHTSYRSTAQQQFFVSTIPPTVKGIHFHEGFFSNAARVTYG